MAGHGKKKVDGFDKNEKIILPNTKMIIHQTKNERCLIFAVGSLTVKHMIVDIAITNIPVAAKRSPATAVILRRDIVTLPAPPKRVGVAWHAWAASVSKE